MEDWNEVVSLVEDFAQDILQFIPIPDSKDYDDLFDMLTKDIYIYTLIVLKKFS